VVIVYVLMILVGAALAVFAMQNSNPVEINFLIWTKSVALALVILLSTLAGLLFASMVALVQQLSLRSRIRALERQAPPPAASKPAPPVPPGPMPPP
jgi:uncharacterized integral membrane protein